MACRCLAQASDASVSVGMGRACYTQTLSGELSMGAALGPGDTRVRGDLGCSRTLRALAFSSFSGAFPVHPSTKPL